MVAKLIVVLLVATAAHAQVRSISTLHKCDSSKGGYYAEHPDSCRRYFICDSVGNLYDGDCGEFGAFHKETSSCVLAEKVGCSAEQLRNDQGDPESENTPVEHAIDDSSYDVNKEADVDKKAKDLPNVLIRPLETGDLVVDVGVEDQVESVADTHFCQGKRDGNYAINNICTEYVRCENGVRHVTACPVHLVYDEMESACVHPALTRRSECNTIEKDAGEFETGDPWGSLFDFNFDDDEILDDVSGVKDFCVGKATGSHLTIDESCFKSYLCHVGASDARVIDCPATLVYDDSLKSCVGLHLTKRKKCLEEVRLVTQAKNGFLCPKEFVAHPVFRDQQRFPNVDDCSKFYICHLNGIQSASACQAPKVYDDRTGLCRHYKQVKGCETFYDN